MTPDHASTGSVADEQLPELAAAGTRLTTVFARNVPSRYDQAKLLAKFAVDGSFDLMYLPFNHKSHRTCGVALVNHVVSFVRRVCVVRNIRM